MQNQEILRLSVKENLFSKLCLYMYMFIQSMLLIVHFILSCAFLAMYWTSSGALNSSFICETIHDNYIFVNYEKHRLTTMLSENQFRPKLTLKNILLMLFSDSLSTILHNVFTSIS